MQQHQPPVQGISAGNAGQSVEERIARILSPDVLAATQRMHEGGTDSDAMLYTATLATALLRLARLRYQVGKSNQREADKEAAHDANLMCGVARSLDEMGFPLSAKHARAVSDAIWDIRTLNMVLGCSALNASDGESGSKTKTYIIKSPASGLIKIGKSVKPDARIKGLSTAAGCKLDVLAIIDDDIEADLHKRFASIRVYGEWFRDDGQISAFAVEVAA